MKTTRVSYLPSRILVFAFLAIFLSIAGGATPGTPPTGEDAETAAYQSTLDTALRQSVKIGRADFTEKCLLLGANPNVAEKNKRTLLHEAAIHGEDVITDLLLKHGANPNAPDGCGKNPAFEAFIWWGDGSEKWVRTLDLLREAGCNFDGKIDKNDALIFEAVRNDSTPMLDAVLRAKPSLTVKDTRGDTPVEFAAKEGHKEAVLKLVAAGGKPPSSIRELAGLGDDKAVRGLLASGTAPDEPDHRGNSALCYAAMSGQTEVVKTLLEAGADPKKSTKRGPGQAITIAADGGNDEVVAALLAAGVDPDASRGGRPDNAMIAAAWNGHLNVVRRLREAGASIDYALLYAAWLGHNDVTDYLLKAGGDPFQLKEPDWQKNALFQAADKGQASTVRLLLDEAGGRFDQASRDEALASVMSHYQMTFARGQHPSAQKDRGRFFDTALVLVEKGAMVVSKKDQYSTPLMEAVLSGNLELVSCLLDKAKAGTFSTCLPKQAGEPVGL
ncbi:MAG: ankyrin repeat domain-containing protein, partial [Terrimicrobiaceae bacterium]